MILSPTLLSLWVVVTAGVNSLITAGRAQGYCFTWAHTLIIGSNTSDVSQNANAYSLL